MNPTENKPELPAEVREAIINTVYQPGFWQRKEPVIELLAALAPLWPKPAPATPDVQDVAEEIRSLAAHNIPHYAYGDNEAACEMANSLAQIEDAAATLTRFAAELTAQKDAEIARLTQVNESYQQRAKDQAARAEKAEAELAGWKADADRCREKWTHYEKLCDQLRAEVQAKQHAIDAAAAQIAQLSAKEARR